MKKNIRGFEEFVKETIVIKPQDLRPPLMEEAIVKAEDLIKVKGKKFNEVLEKYGEYLVFAEM
jgi:hypothetical protein